MYGAGDTAGYLQSDQISKYIRTMGANFYCQIIINIKREKARMNPMVVAETGNNIVRSWFFNLDR